MLAEISRFPDQLRGGRKLEPRFSNHGLAWLLISRMEFSLVIHFY